MTPDTRNETPAPDAALVELANRWRTDLADEVSEADIAYNAAQKNCAAELAALARRLAASAPVESDPLCADGRPDCAYPRCTCTPETKPAPPAGAVEDAVERIMHMVLGYGSVQAELGRDIERGTREADAHDKARAEKSLAAIERTIRALATPAARQGGEVPQCSYVDPRPLPPGGSPHERRCALPGGHDGPHCCIHGDGMKLLRQPDDVRADMWVVCPPPELGPGFGPQRMWSEREDAEDDARSLSPRGIVRPMVFADAALAARPAAGDGEAVGTDELSALLPGVWYMDPPDGGDVSLLEQLRRMTDDARKWREHETAPPAREGVPEGMREALAGLLRYVERQTCLHEETHRAGFIWTICDGCGQKWADDEGGFQPHEDVPEVEAARAALAAAPTAGEGSKDAL